MTPAEARGAITEALVADIKARLERRLRQEADAIIRQAVQQCQDLIRIRADEAWNDLTDDFNVRVQIERRSERT
jgi:phage/plasmid-associated DNA primase